MSSFENVTVFQTETSKFSEQSKTFPISQDYRAWKSVAAFDFLYLFLVVFFRVQINIINIEIGLSLQRVRFRSKNNSI